MKFRPCIDLHGGVVKQIVGSTLKDDQPESLAVNFSADQPASWFADLYRADQLSGGHVIMLGAGNENAAAEALAAWPGGLQIGGGINEDNARHWLDLGASHVIVTSAVFNRGRIDWQRLAKLQGAVGAEHLVLDLSCRRRGDDYFVVTDRWQKFTEEVIAPELLEKLASSCSEFLIHAADVEGKCAGIEEELVERLARWVSIPTTYAGGVRNLEDLRFLNQAGGGRLDVTIGSALDIFGGRGLTYREAVEFCRDLTQG